MILLLGQFVRLPPFSYGCPLGCVLLFTFAYNLYWYRMTLQQKMMTKVMTMMTKKWSLFCRRINTAWVPWRR